MDQTAAKLLPQGYVTELNGVSREFRASSGALGLVFVLALLFIFLVLAAQFESFIDPFVILLAVPLSMVGALLALKWAGGTINVFSQIGLITLVGLITKHGILIVEFSNQLRKQGKETLDAVIEAASLRLRPILMTTGAMVLGALPLARHVRDAYGPGVILRFIEYMDVGATNGWCMDEVLPSAEVVQRLSQVFPLEPLQPNATGETAERWRYLDGGGEIGVISSVTQAFCRDCNRARLSTEGKLFLCLFALSLIHISEPTRPY